MEQADAFEVPFCDLCNTSVPLQDLEDGTAVRHQGKTIGACCLVALRGAGAPAAGRPALVSEPGAAQPRAFHDSRLLPLGIALLAAVAAATIFLDYRLADAELQWGQDTERLETRLTGQADVLGGVSMALDGVVRRDDFEARLARLQDVELAVGRLGEQNAGLAKELRASRTALEGMLREMEERQPDYGPVLTELRQQLQQQAVALAELKAMPRPQPAAPAAAEPLPAAEMAPGLPPELGHLVAKLGDEDPATRFEAVDELLRSKNPAVLEHLLPMAKDADLFVRRLTVEGLRDFRQPSVVDTLITALADPEEIVCDTAWRSLKEVTGQRFPFDYSASRDARVRAQQRWQEWWDKNRETFGSGSGA